MLPEFSSDAFKSSGKKFSSIKLRKFLRDFRQIFIQKSQRQLTKMQLGAQSMNVETQMPEPRAHKSVFNCHSTKSKMQTISTKSAVKNANKANAKIFSFFLCFSRFYSFIYIAARGRRKKYYWIKQQWHRLQLHNANGNIFSFQILFVVSGICEINAWDHSQFRLENLSKIPALQTKILIFNCFNISLQLTYFVQKRFLVFGYLELLLKSLLQLCSGERECRICVVAAKYWAAKFFLLFGHSRFEKLHKIHRHSIDLQQKSHKT